MNAIECARAHRSVNARSRSRNGAALPQRLFCRLLLRLACDAPRDASTEAAHDAAHHAAYTARRGFSRRRNMRRWLVSSGHRAHIRTLGDWCRVAGGFRRRAHRWRRRRWTGIRHLGWCGSLASGHPAVANKEDQEHEGGERGNPHPCRVQAGEPAVPNSFGPPGGGLIAWRKRERNDLPAGRANGKMRECLLLFMRG